MTTGSVLPLPCRRDQFVLFYTGTADNILGFTKQKRYRYQEDNYAMHERS